MDKDELRQQLKKMRRFLLAKGILNDYFRTVESLQKLQPYYVENIIGTYFSSSEDFMNELEQYLNTVPLDLYNVERLIHKVKGGCGSLGAGKVYAVAGEMLEIFKAKKYHRLNAAFQRIKAEHANLKKYLEPYVELLRKLRFLGALVEVSDSEDELDEVESVDSNNVGDNNDVFDFNEDD